MKGILYLSYKKYPEGLLSRIETIVSSINKILPSKHKLVINVEKYSDQKTCITFVMGVQEICVPRDVYSDLFKQINNKCFYLFLGCKLKKPNVDR